MDRKEHHKSQQKVLAIAIAVSVGLHAIALAWLTLDVPLIEEREASRPMRVIELPDDWEDAAIEVVPLETALSLAPSGAANSASATSADVEAPAQGAGGADVSSAAFVDLSAEPSMAPNSPSMTLALAEAQPTLAVSTVLPRSNRGVIRRASTGGAAGSSGYGFTATSDAARDAERERGGGGRPDEERDQQQEPPRREVRHRPVTPCGRRSSCSSRRPRRA